MRNLVLAAALLVSACAPKLVVKPLFPPSVDLQAVTEAKPAPTDAIVLDAQAAARYDADVEGWGSRINAAGGRLCRWAADNGMKGLTCPSSPKP